VNAANAQFTTTIWVQCEFKEWDHTDGRSHVCAKLAKRYRRKDGKKFDILMGGALKENSKHTFRLCEYHYEEVSKVTELEEAILERQFS
jgi:hypothetical protein